MTAAVLEKYWLPVFLIVELVVFSAMRPNTFMTTANFRNIVGQQAVPLMAALALTFPLIVGEFDIGVGAITTASAILIASLMGHGMATPLALLIAVVVAVALGSITALLVARFEVNSFIGSLGVATVVNGLIAARTNGLTLNKNLSPWLTNLPLHRVVGIPLLPIIAVVFAIIVWFVQQQTVYGRTLAALGANRRAANLLGLRTRWLVGSTFLVSGLMASFTGMLQLSFEDAANPTSGGFNLVVTSLTAVFLGATCFRPGHFNVLGTIVGLLFLAVGVSGLSLVGLDAWVQDVFTGIALAIALALAGVFRRRGV